MNLAAQPIAAPSSSTKRNLPQLTVIIPCRNEESFIAQCLDSILASDYPAEKYEIIVADGMSTDQTRTVVQNYSESHGNIRLLNNPKKITPAGLNIGIRSARGEVICRVDAHARISADYLRRCIEGISAGAADNIGGSMRTIPSGRKLMARSIALCMSHKFGVGNSAFRIGSNQPAFTDTVFGGCYRRETLERIGLFNEKLPRTQDFELNQRLRKAGGRILLDPAIRCEYFASPNLRSFAKHNLQDGIWSVLPFAYSDGISVRWRHLISLAFVSTVIAFAIGGLWFRLLWLLLMIQLSSYAAVSLLSVTQLCRRERDGRLLFTMPPVFLTRHFAYGFGSLIAVFVLPAKWAAKLAFARRTASAK